NRIGPESALKSWPATCCSVQIDPFGTASTTRQSTRISAQNRRFGFCLGCSPLPPCRGTQQRTDRSLPIYARQVRPEGFKALAYPERMVRHVSRNTLVVPCVAAPDSQTIPGGRRGGCAWCAAVLAGRRAGFRPDRADLLGRIAAGGHRRSRAGRPDHVGAV